MIVNISPSAAARRHTVHEMAKDEARHGKSFEGLLNRYFGDELKMEKFNKKLEDIAKKIGLA